MLLTFALTVFLLLLLLLIFLTFVNVQVIVFPCGILVGSNAVYVPKFRMFPYLYITLM